MARKANNWPRQHKALVALTVLFLLTIGIVGIAVSKHPKSSNNTQQTATSSDSSLQVSNQANDQQAIDAIKADPNYQKPKPGVSYDELFRNIDSYKGQYLHYTGEVVQVLGSSGNWNLRVNITEKGEAPYTYWDDPVYVFSYSPDRVIEKDVIDFTAYVNGTITYKSVLGGDITVPSLNIYEQKVIGRAD
jgi:hypothetical protein